MGRKLNLLVAVSSMVVLMQSYEVHARSKTICGETDDREPSQNPKIARVQERTAPAGCTLTMVSRTCAVSAGHCSGTFEVAHFNTPPSANGRIQLPDDKDIYEVNKASAVYHNNGRGDDFAVVRLKANGLTGQLPGDVQGFYPVNFDYKPVPGDLIRITGYGADRSDPDRNFAQQTHTGVVFNVSGSILEHQADTMGGNSGSSIILESTGEIIGIHTHGGCHSRGGANASTLLSAREDFKAAIRNCLAEETAEGL